jgi:hypothetical protein
LGSIARRIRSDVARLNQAKQSRPCVWALCRIRIVFKKIDFFEAIEFHGAGVVVTSDKLSKVSLLPAVN